MDNVDKLAKAQEQEAEQEEKKTQSQIIVGLASDMQFFYDEQGTSYARVKVHEHHEVWPIRTQDFKHILTIRYLNLSKDKDKAPGSQAMEDALRVLEAKSKIYGKQEKVHVRVAELEDKIYVDLCNESWQAIEINKKGWRVVDDPPVYFKRSKIMQPLPTPTPDGVIENLKPFINYDNDYDYKLIIAYLLSTFKENNPFPILTIQGEQGSGKSNMTKVLRALIDPSSLPLRALPKEEKDLSIAANNTWILAFDNLSGLSNQMSDALAKVSTGGGLATRKLYTDDEEAVFQIMRPTILNGIDDIGHRQDLLDRSIVLHLPSIEEKKRKDEKTFWKEFREIRPSILGALCTVASQALNELPHTKLSSKPRMADFALWITAAEKALNWSKGEFMEIYTGNREKAIDQGLESDPFASSVLELMKHENKWIGNASQLLGELSRFVDERTKSSKAWPTSRSVRNRLRRINPALKKKDIIYVEYESRKNKTLRLEKVGEISSTTLPSSPKAINQHFEGYDNGYDNSNGYDISSLGYDDEKTSSPYKPHEINVSDDSYDNDDNFISNSKNDDEDLII
ncbi:hypothetical protein SH601_05525 [Gracilibacillus sp. S3-1-1]|uniref:Uncharacterized protein n=1 Tax=Gracilibacillus pellucidus TaxID=3095368 RepID=A0ACC6M3B2_9BACI|nr:hypothetical protein [Gracilibacillus sp. S3-1-1]MDX8045445.1 hypothetical protein [Gracilibacillus sp. S3-1-1]